MIFTTVTAEEIRKDDQILMGDTFAVNPNHRWVSVRQIKRVHVEGEDRVMVITQNHNFLYDPQDKVDIQRFGDLSARTEELK